MSYTVYMYIQDVFMKYYAPPKTKTKSKKIFFSTEVIVMVIDLCVFQKVEWSIMPNMKSLSLRVQKLYSEG